MKTPIQELLERVKEYRDSETSPLVISRLNSICVDIVGMLEKEKEVIIDAWNSAYGGDSFHDGEQYYNETFKTK